MFIELGNTVQTLPMGRVGTVTDIWCKNTLLNCECCYDVTMMLTVEFADGTEDDFEEGELQQI